MFIHARRTQASATDPTTMVRPGHSSSERQATPIPVAHPHSAHEQAADAIAARVSSLDVRGSASTAAGAIAPVSRNRLSALEGNGEPLSGEVRSYFEPRMGENFADVQLHRDAAAEGLAVDLKARALTFGPHVAFAKGQYEPKTSWGRRLLAHELAHVAQQRGQADGVIMREAAPSEPTEGVTGTLWAKDTDGKDLPPSLDDISQGNLGDCYLIAALAAIVRSNPNVIKQMITDNGDGTYTVTMKGIGFWSSAKQTVTATFPVGKHANVTGTKAIWPLIVEKAYAQEKGSYKEIESGNAGDATKALTDVGPSRFDPRDETADYILAKVKEALDKHWPATINSPKKDKASAEKKQMAVDSPGLYFNHAYVFVDIDVQGRRVKLFNPWGNSHPNGTGWIGVDQLRNFFIEININD